MAEANPNIMSARIEGEDGKELSSRDFENILYSMQRSLDALSAFSNILDLAVHHDAGALTSSDSGLSYLMDCHIHDLAEARQELWQYRPTFEDRQASSGVTPVERILEAIRVSLLAADNRPAWHDLDTISARSRVRKAEVARVMFILTGEDHEGAAYRAWDGNLSEGVHSHLLSGLCWEALSRCDMFGQVSTATGLDLGKLREVLQAILEYSPKRQSISLEPFGDVREAQLAEAAMYERVAARDAEKIAEDQPPAATATELRDALIAEKLREGVKPAIIAQAMNLRKSAVDKVATKLTAETQDALPTAKAG